MKIRKHSLDGGDHYPPQTATGTTNQELADEMVALSATDGGYIVNLGEYDGTQVTAIHAFAINGILVENALGSLT